MDYLHGLRHENLNVLIGCLTDPNRPALVLEWCSRGSLEDVLVQDEIKLDWSFRLSLLTDLVRGMKYLHSSPIRVHGYLTSRNCIIDARWVLKITDYGLPAFYEAQNITAPSKTARDLLWTAPELLRSSSLRKTGTQPGDVYSFGIIMQEVVVRGEPFCMLSLSPEDIIEKVKKPPPLIRPSVSKGAAPPEAINIMRQCWAEQADMRPDFNAVHDLFKKLNHGRKVNFVDTMFQMLEKYSNNLEELIRERTEQLDMEKKKTEQLLNRMLPSSVADKLKLGMPVDPEDFREVTIYFSDIVGFTTISAYSTPFEIATMALDLLHQSGRFKIRHLPYTPLRLRIGLHTGPCCAGVVGLTMPRYCLFGDTVNTASRMESTATKEQLDEVGGYQLEYRDEIDVKGKGKMHTYWLLGKSDSSSGDVSASFATSGGLTPPSYVPTAAAIESKPRPIHTSPEPQLSSTVPRSSSAEQTSLTSKTNSNANLTFEHKSVKVSASVHSEKVNAKDETNSIDDIKLLEFNELPHHKLSMKKSSEISRNDSGKVSDASSSTAVKSSASDHQMVYGHAVSATDVAAALLGVSSSTQSINNNNLQQFRSSNRDSHHNRHRRAIAGHVDEDDLSTPYNHYRCLSPSEQHLNHLHHNNHYIKPHHGTGSGVSSNRFLKRQFSLDRGDDPSMSILSNVSSVSTMTLDSASCIAAPRAASTGRLCKQNSAGAAHDLERIEEIPLTNTCSPVSPRLGNQKTTMNSNYFRNRFELPPSSMSNKINYSSSTVCLMFYIRFALDIAYLCNNSQSDYSLV
ncbi:hypothetical protein C0J52_17493 [Blattella germanica]|nr:hypothetical protein C0J52_17493 [Blattella germanica]